MLKYYLGANILKNVISKFNLKSIPIKFQVTEGASNDKQNLKKKFNLFSLEVE